jgi:hypothetical protein
VKVEMISEGVGDPEIEDSLEACRELVGSLYITFSTPSASSSNKLKDHTEDNKISAEEEELEEEEELGVAVTVTCHRMSKWLP